jgi:hypothetical protein
MKLKSFGILALMACSFLLYLCPETGLPQKLAQDEQADFPSECVRCHTNVKGLIRLGWEVEKVKPKAGKSAQTSGEG